MYLCHLMYLCGAIHVFGLEIILGQSFSPWQHPCSRPLGEMRTLGPEPAISAAGAADAHEPIDEPVP